MAKYEKKEYKKKKIKINKLYLVNSWENIRGNDGSLPPFEVCGNDMETIMIVSARFPGLVLFGIPRDLRDSHSGRNKEKLGDCFFFTILRKRSCSDRYNHLGVWRGEGAVNPPVGPWWGLGQNVWGL